MEQKTRIFCYIDVQEFHLCMLDSLFGNLFLESEPPVCPKWREVLNYAKRICRRFAEKEQPQSREYADEKTWNPLPPPPAPPHIRFIRTEACL
jgi:hypothetical protein